MLEGWREKTTSRPPHMEGKGGTEGREGTEGDSTF